MTLLVLALAVAAFAKERQVGLFYFLWLGEHGRTKGYRVGHDCHSRLPQ